MFKNKNVLMFTLVALIGCFSVTQANYMSFDWNKHSLNGWGFEHKAKKHSYAKKHTGSYLDLLTYGKKYDKNFTDFSFYPYTSYDKGYNWNSYANLYNSGYNYNWNWNYDWNKYSYTGKNWGSYMKEKPVSHGNSTSVPEPSLMLLMLSGIAGLIILKKKAIV